MELNSSFFIIVYAVFIPLGFGLAVGLYINHNLND